MKSKILILLFLLTFPSVLYVILSTGKTHFIHLNYFGEKKLSNNGKDTIYHAIPPFQLINQEGKIVSDKNYSGKIYVANFFSSQDNSIYSQTIAELLRVQEKFMYTNENNKDSIPVKILSHTINPENDSVPVLKSYAIAVKADSKMWDFVTGNKAQLYALAQNGYLVSTIKDNNNSINCETFVLVDKEKHIRGIYNATNIKEVNNLLDDIKVLLAEYFIKGTKNKKSNE